MCLRNSKILKLFDKAQMGTTHSQPPKNGQIMTIVNNQWTESARIPASVLSLGSKVKVLGTKDLLCSRQYSEKVPRISGTLVLLPDGKKEVFLTSNLR
jgi:hypothetical protein